MDKFKYIFFDLDGTLIDTIPLILESFKYTFTKHFGESRPEEEIISFIGLPMWDILHGIYPGKEAEITATYMEYNLNRYERGIAIFTGIYPMLKELYEKGITLAVITSRKKLTTNIALELFELSDFFKFIITSEDTQKHKPNGEPLLKAMQMAGISDPSGVLYVGDSPVDILCAKNAGTKSAAVAWTYNPRNKLGEAFPDIFLESPEDLLKFV